MGRGEALRFGINKSKGDIIVTHPSDGEYSANDMENVVKPIFTNMAKIVFGSRMIKCINLKNQIEKIYKNNWKDFFISKYGGILLSALGLIFYNRYVGDILTTFKAFDGSFVKKQIFKSKGVEFEIEQLAKFSNSKNFILEVPVNYSPQNKLQGKKITLVDGLKCIGAYFKY